MKIGDLARRTGLSVDTLRYYEKIGLVRPPSRDRGGRRAYDDGALRWIDFLKRLKATGMPLAEMISYGKLRDAGDVTSAARRALLETHRLRVVTAVADLTENIAVIDGKIETYLAIEADLALKETP